jgi:pimeloyl-ACP methyl ester carboxylesterase
MKIYFISGLAADKRMFKYIQLPAGYEAVFLNWIEPLKKESLRQYAIRLATGINTAEPFVILGLSMGGMMAVEIALRHQPVATILVSSLYSHKQLPRKIRWVSALGVHRWVPISFLKSASVVKRFFTTEATADKMMLKQIIKESNTTFIRWAITAMVEWRNEVLPNHLYHLHGTKDNILPIRYVNPTHTIEKGGHLMVMNNYHAINSCLAQILSKY